MARLCTASVTLSHETRFELGWSSECPMHIQYSTHRVIIVCMNTLLSVARLMVQIWKELTYIVMMEVCLECPRSISLEGYEEWHPHNWPVTTTNHLDHSTPGQLPWTSKVVCVCLYIIAPSIPLTYKTMCTLLQFQEKGNPIIEYISKMQYKLRCQAFFYVKYIPSYPCENRQQPV